MKKSRCNNYSSTKKTALRKTEDFGENLPLTEDFYSIQGEGFHTGKPAYFIRLGGCDIGCRWCDSKFTWNSGIHPLISIDTIVAKVKKAKACSIVVTGGEPLLYNLAPLCRELKKNKITTYLETSGAHPLSGEWDWICLSPKKDNPPISDIYKKANELKVIIYDKSDLQWALQTADYVKKTCHLFLQPEWSRYRKNIPWIIDFVKKNPTWRISLQSHKFMKIQ